MDKKHRVGGSPNKALSRIPTISCESCLKKEQVWEVHEGVADFSITHCQVRISPKLLAKEYGR